MALELVHDSAKVETIPVGNLNDIADMARRFADRIDAGEFGEIIHVTVVIETVSGLQRDSWGEMPSGYELMGLLEAMKLRVFADEMADD